MGELERLEPEEATSEIAAIRRITDKFPQIFWRGIAQLRRSGVFLLLALPAAAWSHQGAGAGVDPCKIQVGYEQIHVTAYTPTLFAGKQHCQNIPAPVTTTLVFDYVGKKLRQITLEFEVTKEPEGRRVFYQAPIKNVTGTMSASIDFSQFGAGDYLVHVTIVHKGKRLDAHLPLKVGKGVETSKGVGAFVLLLALLAAIYFILKHNGFLEKYFKSKILAIKDRTSKKRAQ